MLAVKQEGLCLSAHLCFSTTQPPVGPLRSSSGWPTGMSSRWIFGIIAFERSSIPPRTKEPPLNLRMILTTALGCPGCTMFDLLSEAAVSGPGGRVPSSSNGGGKTCWGESAVEN